MSKSIVKSPYFFLSLIIALGAFLRLLYLGSIPTAIGGDELTYFLTSKAVFLSGHDITGSWTPLQALFFHYPPGTIQAELPYFLNLLVSPLPFSLFNARILYALIGIGAIPLMYFAAKKLVGEKAGLFAVLLISINPWEIYLSRTSYEMGLALFFFLASLCALLYFKGAKSLWTIPLLVLSFYSYIGTKVFFLPFVLITLGYLYVSPDYKKGRNYYAIILLCAALLFIFYTGILLFGHQANRASDLFTPLNPELAQQVNDIRHVSITNPLVSIFENKPMEYLKILTEKFYNTLSFDYLFSQGDLFFSIPRQGLFYVIDLPFLLIGGAALFYRKRRVFYFVGLLFFASLLPQLLHAATTTNFTAHLAVFFIFAFIFMGEGIATLVSFFKNHALTTVIILLLYVLVLLNFMQIYFFQFPIQAHFDFQLRTLASYIEHAKEFGPVTIYTNTSHDSFEKYLFYANQITPATLPAVQEDFKNKTYAINSVSFKNCPGKNFVPLKNQTSILDVNCGIKVKNQVPLFIAQLKDSGALYRIYNDQVCKDVALSHYIHDLKLSDFAIEQMPAATFCSTYVIY